MQIKSKMIGKKVYIIDKNSFYYNEWGIIKYYDGEYYHIAIANGEDILPIFKRNEFKVKKQVK